MSLDSFIQENNYHDNSKLDKKKLHVDRLCSECGEPAEHVRNSEYRCNNDFCEVVYYFANNFNTDNA